MKSSIKLWKRFFLNFFLTLCGILFRSPSLAFFVKAFTPGRERQNLGRTVVPSDNSS